MFVLAAVFGEADVSTDRDRRTDSITRDLALHLAHVPILVTNEATSEMRERVLKIMKRIVAFNKLPVILIAYNYYAFHKRKQLRDWFLVRLVHSFLLSAWTLFFFLSFPLPLQLLIKVTLLLFFTLLFLPQNIWRSYFINSQTWLKNSIAERVKTLTVTTALPITKEINSSFTICCSVERVKNQVAHSTVQH